MPVRAPAPLVLTTGLSTGRREPLEVAVLDADVLVPIVAWDATSLVFTTERGRHLHPDNVSQAFAVAASALDDRLTRFSIHGLRHTHATHLLAAGVNPKVVSERLGHHSVAFTLDTYAHVMPGQQAEAAAAAARLLDT